MSETHEALIPKTMLILKSQITAITVIEIFLRNRGWKIYSTVNLKDALVQIVSQKPSYVLISVDHANKKARALPKLLASAFPVATIVFAETQSSFSYNALNESATEYRVYPPVTGPAIERCVNKYLKDQQTKISIQANENLRSINSNHFGSNNISIKGSGSDFNSNNANRLLSEFLGEEADSQTLLAAAKADSNLVFAQAIDDDSRTADANYIPGQKTEDTQEEQSRSKGFGQTYVQKGSTGNIGTYIPSNAGLGSREYRRNQSAASWVPSDTSETLIARGAQKSLEDSVELGDGIVKDKIEETTSAACIVVESLRFSGYLVAVMGKNCKIDKTFIESIKTKLFKFLKENGEELSESDAMDVKIKQVDFEPWALEYADFLRKSVHQGNEVAMAFFPRRPIKMILEESPSMDMAKILLSELQGDRQVEFDLYIYLPNNNKYVLYTPKGGVFYDKQMDRLKKQGVTHLHVQKDSVPAITKYQAQNYLNDMVDEHKQKQEATANIKAAS